MSLDGLSAFLAAGLASGAPIALAALGGLFTEAAGALTVALEGSMLAGAFAAAAVAQAAGPLGGPAGFLAGALAGLALAALLALASERLGANVFVAGLAANLLAPGLVSLLSEYLFGTKGVVAAPGLGFGLNGHGGLASLPLVGPALFGQSPAFYLVAGLALVLGLVFEATPFGLRLRASGDPGEAAAAAGIDRSRSRFLAHLVAGGAAGLAGAVLASEIGAFVPGMSAGRGWIALVAIYLGGKRPAGVLLASLGFGVLIAASNAAQALARAPAELILSLPYLATVIALVAGKAAARKARWRA